MLIQATQKYTRQTPRKVRLVAKQVKGKTIAYAIEQLSVIERKASVVVLKVLRQAIANAVNNHGLKLDQLNLKNILVDEGPSYKRFQPVSRGRAHSILKRSCHITVQLETAPIADTVPAAPVTAPVTETKTAAEPKKPAASKKVSTKAPVKRAPKTKKEA